MNTLKNVCVSAKPFLPTVLKCGYWTGAAATCAELSYRTFTEYIPSDGAPFVIGFGALTWPIWIPFLGYYKMREQYDNRHKNK